MYSIDFSIQDRVDSEVLDHCRLTTNKYFEIEKLGNFLSTEILLEFCWKC